MTSSSLGVVVRDAIKDPRRLDAVPVLRLIRYKKIQINLTRQHRCLPSFSMSGRSSFLPLRLRQLAGIQLFARISAFELRQGKHVLHLEAVDVLYRPRFPDFISRTVLIPRRGCMLTRENKLA